MAKGMYIGVDGKARKVKKMYIGVDGVARKIKKAYIGIGGVARPCFGGGGLEYYGQITNLMYKRQSCAATQIGKYALFAGGNANAVTQTTSAVGSVFAYNESLTRTRPTDLGSSRSALAATTVGNMALFLGGYSGGSLFSIDCYLESLTKKSFGSAKSNRHNHAATTVGKYALFAGGYRSSISDAVNNVESIDSSGTQKAETALKTIRYCLAATTVGDYALFGGGIDADPDATVDAYNTGLTKTIPTGLSEARYYLAATTVGDYALFGGGMGKSKYYATVDAYDKSLTRTTPAPLSAVRQRLDAATIGGYAVFGCGLIGGGEKNVVDVYDESLTLTQTTPFSVPRYHYSAVTVGDYILFGGGQKADNTVLTTVEAYVFERPEITINLVMWRIEGDTIYATESQTVSFKAKIGMKYSDLAFADTNTVELPNGCTLKIKFYNGYPAYQYMTQENAELTVYKDSDVYVSTPLADGMTIDFTSAVIGSLDMNWEIK